MLAERSPWGLAGFGNMVDRRAPQVQKEQLVVGPHRVDPEALLAVRQAVVGSWTLDREAAWGIASQVEGDSHHIQPSLS